MKKIDYENLIIQPVDLIQSQTINVVRVIKGTAFAGYDREILEYVLGAYRDTFEAEFDYAGAREYLDDYVRADAADDIEGIDEDDADAHVLDICTNSLDRFIERNSEYIFMPEDDFRGIPAEAFCGGIRKAQGEL